MKITFIGAGSTVFCKNVLGDCLLAENLPEFEIALLDIDAVRLEESYALICALRDKYKPVVTVKKYLATDVSKRKRPLGVLITLLTPFKLVGISLARLLTLGFLGNMGCNKR